MDRIVNFRGGNGFALKLCTDTPTELCFLLHFWNQLDVGCSPLYPRQTHMVKEDWCWWYRKYMPGDTVLEGLEKEGECPRKDCG